MNGRLLRYGFLAAALVALPAGAQLYKWTDANGRVQYSDKPPPAGQKATSMSRATMSAVPGESAPATPEKSTADREQEFRKRQADQQEAQKKQVKVAEDQRIKQSNCQSAQRQLAAAQSGQRMATIDSNGERRYLDENEIQQSSQQAQQEVAKYCN
jgi:hypothetical protein